MIGVALRAFRTPSCVRDPSTQSSPFLFPIVAHSMFHSVQDNGIGDTAENASQKAADGTRQAIKKEIPFLRFPFLIQVRLRELTN